MNTGYKVEDLMTNMPVTVDKEISLKEAALLMKKYNVNSLLVLEDEKLVGVVTDEDFVRKYFAESDKSENSVVADIMETDLVTVEPHTDLYKAVVKMRDNNIRHLPVLKDEKLVGFLTMKDILKIQPELFDILVESMEIREQERKLKQIADEEEEI